MPDDYPRLPQRRPSLRSVPTTERFIPTPMPAPVVRPQMQTDEGLIETLRKLWRHRRTIAVCTIVAGGIAAAVAWSLPSYYVAEARVQVGVQSPRVFNAEAILTDANPDAERVQNESFVLQSRTLAKQVIDKLHLDQDPAFNPELQKPSFWARNFSLKALLPASVSAWLSGLHSHPAEGTPPPDQALTQRENMLIDILLSHIDVSLLGRSYVLSVKADAQDPNMAASLANTLAKTYLDYQRADKIATMDKVDKFLLNRINELRDQVRKSDQAVEDYRRQHGLYKSANNNVTAQQLTELNSQLITAQTAKAEAESRLAEAQAVSKSGLGNESVPEVLRSPLIASLKQQEADAERRMAEMSAMYGPRYPAMINARAEVGNARAKIAAEIAKTVDGLAREARAADARFQAVSQDFEKLKSKMGTVNDASIQLEALERDSAVNRNLLEAMLNRAKQSTGAEAILQADAKLVSPAAPPAATSYPPKTLIAFLGLVGGFLLGSAVALLRESSDHTFRRAEQVEALTGLPVLAMVPQLSSRVPPAMQVLRHPTSPYSEALRRVQIGVELSQAASSPRTMLFSSATPSEGKSVMVASLGRLLASNGRRVLLIDCDWRSPRLHQIFRCSNRDGLASLLGDKSVVLDDLIYHDALSGVDVLPSGNWSPNQAHLLSSDRMRQLIEALTPHYDFVVLDTAPALVTADVLALSRLVEKVVFVVRWGYTRQDAVFEALKQIIDAQGDVAGVVLSRVVSREYRRYGHRDPFYEYSRPIKATYG
ncbi:GumC family protein [Enhydrobacter aerosaccus]|nr:polysaccharide biosynthesis tyrosine autokinase [Enhydrobacter aerosaccus]